MPENRAGSGRFSKGRSGNPGGRPKLEGDVRTLAQKHSRAVLERLIELTKSDNERVAVVACQAVLDRALGKPPQGIHFQGNGGAMPGVRIEFVKPTDGV
jgi:hypothetical protein